MGRLSEQDRVRFLYNCHDIDYTLQVAEVLIEQMERQPAKLQEFFRFQQYELAPALVNVMKRGVRVDQAKKEDLKDELSHLMRDVEAKFNWLVGETFNPKSPIQVKRLFKDLLGVVPVKSNKGTDTFGAAAMVIYLEEYPMLTPLITLILEYRTLQVFVGTFLSAQVDDDGRMRSSYNVAGTSTYRLASRKNAFGNGMNLQNVPSKGKMDLSMALASVDTGEDSFEGEELLNVIYSEGVTELPNCKELFIPDDGYTFFDVDYSGADAMVVGWDSECEWLMDFFTNQDEKLYIYLGQQYLQRPMTTSDPLYKKFKAFCHGCVTGDHEVLTKDGWVRIDGIADCTEIAVWDKETSEVHFEVPKSYNRDYVDSEEDLYSIEGSSFSFLGTQDHKFPYMLSSGKHGKSEAVNLNKTARIPYSGKLVGGVTLDPTWVKLLVALQADGSIQHECTNGETTVRWKFKKDRKIERLVSLLWKLYQPYKITKDAKGCTNIFVKGLFQRKHKILDWSILKLSQSNLQTFVDELQYWDGHVRTSNGVRTSVTTVLPETCEILQTVIHLVGKASKTNCNRRTGFSDKPLYEISINARNYYRVENGERKLVSHKGTEVYCPQTSTGYFMIRRNGNIYVSGNTNYGMGVDKAARTAGMSLLEAKKLQKFYFDLCPEIPRWHKRIKDEVYKRGYVENIFGARGYFLNRNDHTLLNKAYAYIPQSTIGIMVNKGLVSIEKEAAMLTETRRMLNKGGLDMQKHTNLSLVTDDTVAPIEVLMQVHDSLAGQIKTTDVTAPERIIKHMSIELPYKTPLVIPVDIATSVRSYGDC